MSKTKIKFFEKRFTAMMLIAVVISGTMSESLVSFAAEKEIEVVQEAEVETEIEEADIVETEIVQQTEQVKESVSFKEELTETKLIEKQEINLSTEPKTEMFVAEEETKEDKSEEKETEIVIGQKNNNLVSGEFQYSLQGDSEIEITGYLGNNIAVNIPPMIDGHTVTEIGEDAFRYKDIVSISLSDTITSIGPRAFYGCRSLSSVKLSKNIKNISDEAFRGCQVLSAIELPKSLEMSGYYVFSECDNLKSASFEIGTTKIPDDLFCDCTGLEEVEIPDTVTSIGNNVFIFCSKLNSIKLPANLTEMGGNVFSGTAIKSIEIPKSLKKAGWYDNEVMVGAFQGCESLKSASFEAGTTQIAYRLFQGCESLEHVEIPDTVTHIGYNAFYDCVNLKNVILPRGLTNIDNGAFGYCSSLQSIIIPENITSISNNTFTSCSNLEKVNFPENLISIGESAFFGTKLSELDLPEGLQEIQDYAFYSCDELTQVSLPDSVMVIGKYIFSECGRLNEIEFGMGITKVPDHAFDYCQSLKNIVLPYWVMEIDTYAFANCPSLTSITIPRKTTTIDADVFYNSPNMIIRGVVGSYAEKYAKENSIKFESITIPATQIHVFPENPIVNRGSTLQLSLAVTPEDFTDEINWSIIDTNIITIDEKGWVSGIAKGTATVRVTVGELSKDIKIVVNEPVSWLSISQYAAELQVGDTLMLTTSVYPDDATIKTITWSSSVPTVATVNQDGIITAISGGVTVIKVEAADGSGTSASCTVTVLEDGILLVNDCTVTFETNGGSSVASIVCKYGSRLSGVAIEEPTKEGHLFTGWYKDSDCKIPWDTDSDTVTEDITLYAAWTPIKTGLWAVPAAPQTYTGKAIKPSVTVYSGTTKLVPQKDYSISYKNNVNVYIGGDSAKKPQIIIKGKGNYKDNKIIYFEILPKQISDTDVIFDNLYVAAGTQPKQLVPTATWNGKKLKYNKNTSKSDYKVTLPQVNYSSIGTYSVTITGQGNYGGTREIDLVVSNKALLNKASVRVAKGMSYNDGNPVMPSGLVVKLKGKTLQKDTDYIVVCKNNTEIGTATAFIKGIGSYSGEKMLRFNIVGENIKGANITGIVNKQYSGAAVTQAYTVRCGSKQLEMNKDFTLRYENNVHAGTASMIFTGINGYSGTVKKTFKILPCDIQSSGGLLSIDCGDTAKLRKSGAQPTLAIMLDGKKLIPDIDYKLSYKNNKNTGSAQVQIKGIGNFKGSVTKSFTIVPDEEYVEAVNKNKDISKAKIKVKDRIYTGDTVTIDKSDIISITIGTMSLKSDDYEILADTYQNNVKKGTAKVTIHGRNGYGGEKQITFKITNKSLTELQ